MFNKTWFRAWTVLLLIFAQCFCVSALQISASENPDVNLPTPDIISRHGYPAETHTIQTKDGYLLGIHRIPHGKFDISSQRKRPVVFLQHGILGSSADWTVTGPEKGFGFLLAERGYDVWMGNARGNSYSRSHAYLSPDSLPFWQFSWDEMAELDLPAAFDYILNGTEQKSLFYIGHSLGTTMFFALMSSLPEYNKKINVMVALAPVVFVSNMKSPIRYLVPWAHDIEFLNTLLGKGELLPENKVMSWLAIYLCGQGNVAEEICANFLFVLAGYDKPQLNETTLPLILSHVPAGTSAKTAIQFAQQIKSGVFSKFDFGKEDNKKRYNSTTPPKYSLQNVKVPVALIYSDNDLLVDLSDLDKLINRLPNIVDKYEVPYAGFNHIDYVFANDAPTLVYQQVFKILTRFDRENFKS